MVYTEQNTKFIDKDGLIYLINQLREDIDNIDTSNIDLSNYVTNEQLQEALRNAGVDVDLSTYATKEELLEAINSIDLSAYALKTEIPSTDGLATTEYVDNAVANIPTGGGDVDLSNYYTKEETYSKTEVDTAISNIEGGNTSSDSCALYDTVVANGGAVKEIIETEKGISTKLSEIISDVADGKEVVGDENGYFYISMNPDKTQEELNAEFVLPNDENGRLDFLLASSFQPEELFASNLKDRLKNGERMHYIIASKTGNNYGNYEFYYCEVFYNRISENGYLQDTCYNDMYKIYQGNVKFNLLKYMQNMKYICSGAYYNGGLSIGGSYAHFNDKYDPINWLRFKKYLPTGTEYSYPIIGENAYSQPISENISSPEFSAYLLDTYLSNCNEMIKISETVNYTLAEWGDKLDNSQGEDGISPTVSITETDNGHTVSITDVNGTQSFDVTNGTNGTDGTNGTNGVSPTVTVTKEGKVATITCTDANGTTTASISDGEGGSSSGGSSGITYAYDTEIATGETYFDGRPIYMKIFHIDALSSAPSDYIVYGNYHSQTPFADTLVSAEPIWQSNSNQKRFNGNVIQSFTSASGSSGSAAITAVNRLLKTVAWVQAWQSSSEFAITVTRGQDMYEYGCDVFVKYVKSA